VNQQHGASGSESRLPKELRNDTVINVAQIMKDDVGSRRSYRIALDTFSLDTDITAKDVTADLKLTRITRGILATGHVSGTALVECHRCLNVYEQPFENDFDQEYRPMIDVRSGLLVEQPDPGEELGSIDEAHELDVAEPIRQVAIIDLPIKRVCQESCPGLELDLLENEDPDIDRRLGVLKDLLGPDDETEAE
jgi:uncharacterized protein